MAEIGLRDMSIDDCRNARERNEQALVGQFTVDPPAHEIDPDQWPEIEKAVRRKVREYLRSHGEPYSVPDVLVADVSPDSIRLDYRLIDFETGQPINEN